ncbi:HD domain-containing protein ['Fragaria x ananassa' phyllody phytoplasma]|uniref:HD domain-containing protein n=1 Tax='Fragaria x ananassa' phyllody phytoplasma TaxID=2358428 RepID=A0ABS5K2Y0_9MOLU|nr:HD domain-containing protein ['Fragaria x ananassa' phyllody phytoplasma]MBS2126248.1 HD domain-containing protein ['Fragaria x ananassa' phyllody phytoplasma]
MPQLKIANKKFCRPEVFRDPIYGYVYLQYQIIEKLIDTSAFQRLRRIKQLSGANIVFHNAEHSRFTHSLGVYELARRFLNINNLQQHFSENEQLLLLISALLHDIGHSFYSHSFEALFDCKHEKQGALIIQHDPEISALLEEINPNFKNDVASIVAKKNKFPLIEQILSGQIDIDRLDYLERDAYFTGAIYGHIDLERLMRSMIIETNPQTQQKCIAFRQSGVFAVENYLINRYHMFWQVYYHPKVRAYMTILEKICQRLKLLLKTNYSFDSYIDIFKNLLDDPKNYANYLALDDTYINALILHLQNSSDLILKNLCRDFINRSIWNVLDNNEDNQAKINDIKNQYANLNLEYVSYYTSLNTVDKIAYSENNENFADNILIKTQNQLKSLKEESLIIKSLIESGSKKDHKFFYRALPHN